MKGSQPCKEQGGVHSKQKGQHVQMYWGKTILVMADIICHGANDRRWSWRNDNNYKITGQILCYGACNIFKEVQNLKIIQMI